MAESLIQIHKKAITELELIPSGGGVFEVELNGQVIFSKKALGRHAKDGEIEALIRSGESS